jgi:hypothetical protein
VAVLEDELTQSKQTINSLTKSIAWLQSQSKDYQRSVQLLTSKLGAQPPPPPLVVVTPDLSQQVVAARMEERIQRIM